MSGKLQQPDIVNAVGLRGIGVAYWESAKLISSEFGEKGIPGKLTQIPYYQLVCHAAEVLLKCALLKRCYSIEQLKKHPLGHNLDTLIVELEGLKVPVTRETKNTIKDLNVRFVDHSYRYDFMNQNGKKFALISSLVVNKALDEILLLGAINTHGR